MLDEVTEPGDGWRASQKRDAHEAVGLAANGSTSAGACRRKVLGRERTSTTLDIYTHAQDDYEHHVMRAFEDPAVFRDG